MESVRSLGYRTSLSPLQQAGSTVVDHGDHVPVSTAGNPDSGWGNFLLLRQPPTTEQAPEWVARLEPADPERVAELDREQIAFASRYAATATRWSGDACSRRDARTEQTVAPAPPMAHLPSIDREEARTS